MYSETTSESRIYIGLNDSITKQQLFETDKYKSVLKNVCYSYHVSFSVSMLEGGYFSEDGGYVNENSLVITLIDVKPETVEEIAQELYISQATARRDLHQLETKGLVKLLYGNIIPLTDGPHDLPLAFRQNQARDSKRTLARKAVDMIPNGSTVMMDASSSVLAMTEFIGSDKDLTVFTNCIKTALKLCENSVTVYLIGGRIDNSNFVTSGAWTDTSVNSIKGQQTSCPLFIVRL